MFLQVLLVQVLESPLGVYTHFIFLLSALTLHFQPHDQPFLFLLLTCMNKNGPAVFPDVKCLQRTLCQDSGD